MPNLPIPASHVGTPFLPSPGNNNGVCSAPVQGKGEREDDGGERDPRRTSNAAHSNQAVLGPMQACGSEQVGQALGGLVVSLTPEAREIKDHFRGPTNYTIMNRVHFNIVFDSPFQETVRYSLIDCLN